ncbi:hypothetical protein NQ318_010051 [Aromia moschata]|uniref:Uncharacterized protein n=1 Tax=Aromia moschata TaxID=1265417 RepID=A0AAV8X3L6_9CUCU|nr:hypothetical protein NQ318_010051 [Aromia moschata]
MTKIGISHGRELPRHPDSPRSDASGKPRDGADPHPDLRSHLLPCFAKLRVLENSLHRMAIGGIVAGLAFFSAGILELVLETTYPELPDKNHASVNVINTLPCDLKVLNPFNGMQIINSSEIFRFKNILCHNYTKYTIAVEAPLSCGPISFSRHKFQLDVVSVEYQIDTVLIGINPKNEIQAYITDPVDFKKIYNGNASHKRTLYNSTTFRRDTDNSKFASLPYEPKFTSGLDTIFKNININLVYNSKNKQTLLDNPKDKINKCNSSMNKDNGPIPTSPLIAYIKSSNLLRNVTVTLRNTAELQDVYFVHDSIASSLAVSAYMELPQGIYECKISSNEKRHLYEKNFHLALGGVYSLVIRENGREIEPFLARDIEILNV